jgi:hypothetical protein
MITDKNKTTPQLCQKILETLNSRQLNMTLRNAKSAFEFDIKTILSDSITICK